ncbi:phage regulatory protein/antirepressor Ant [Limosilactobacillus reuteri]|uniref:phage regulatory protein/antirepressor Ant n=1 Tax=Limosilactobacillus reuteri TaxID=1598 RepID=UPI001E5D1645|nr:phage regulatory protein/antirepressor Ant [Limosilactobacillus reuteri]MCC4347672.1 phage regulatory protein/antirepressor Ant [Limosilactobacillus reuteri]MCC4385952.1 phage regulatory protein/antirepressor Ant [Limosilactobacillus reuteri]
MNEPQLLTFQGEPALDSREIAKMIGKRHAHLMRDIRCYINDMEENPKLDSRQFFIESNYESSQGKLLPCYLLTKMGCEFVANKMTSKKGTLFTAQYVSLFNEYQASLKKPDSYTIDDPVKRAERWIEERKAYEALVPKGQYFDSQMRNPGTMTVAEIAKDYGMTATKLNRLLHEFGVQFKQGKHWVLYHKYDGKGYTQYEAFAYNDNKGVHNNLKWTQRGRKFIYDTLKEHGILPVLEQPELLPEVNAVD